MFKAAAQYKNQDDKWAEISLGRFMAKTKQDAWGIAWRRASCMYPEKDFRKMKVWRAS